MHTLRLSREAPFTEAELAAIGAAAPGCTVTLEDAPPGAAAAQPTDAPAPEPTPLGTDPWKLVDAGDPRAEQLFTGTPLDSAGRTRVQTMLASADAATVAQACRIARWTDWRSGAQLIRRLVPHPSAVVRKEAVVSIGALAGPSLTMTIRPLRTDPDPDVRAAAIAVLKQFGD